MITSQKIWKKIEEFELDDITSSFCFSDRLARENSWSTEFTLRTIHEYKKFIYLICISDSPQTPSDQILFDSLYDSFDSSDSFFDTEFDAAGCSSCDSGSGCSSCSGCGGCS